MNITSILFLVILLIFIGNSTYFAINLKRDIIPDETYHFSLSKYFATSIGIPPNGPETYQYGPITHRPDLFYWINARVINVLRWLIPSISDWKLLVSLRLISIIYSSLAILFCYLLGREILNNKWWQLFAIFLLTNTLMFVFLAAGVNYDTLTNLCSFAAIYYLVRVFNGKNFFTNSLGWLIWILLGALVKITILPLGLASFVAWLVFAGKDRRAIRFNPTFDWKMIGILVITGVLIALNIGIYGVNIVRYRKLTPACNQILTVEQCNQNPVVQRDETLKLGEKLTLSTVLKDGYPDPAEWLLDYWIPTMLRRVYGIFGHKSYVPDAPITVFRLFLLWVIFIAGRYVKNASYGVVSLAAIFVFYSCTLVYTNYNSELINGFKHVATQGRYIFPVIGIAYVLLVYCFSTIKESAVRWATVILSLLLFIWVSPSTFFIQRFPTVYPKQAIQSKQPIGEITGGMVVSQDFTSQCRGSIDQVELLLATYGRANSYPVVFRLIDAQNEQVITEQVLETGTILDNTWRKFIVPTLAGSFGKTYRITITSPNSIPGNAITIWSSDTDAYPNGSANVNGGSTGVDLDFRYTCLQPTLIDWSN